MARTTGDTFAEGLRKMLGQLGQLSALPDADLEFIQQLQGMMAGYMRSGVSSVGGGDVQLTQPSPTPMGVPASPMAGGAGPMMGLSPTADPTSMDEIRRTLGSQSRAI